MILWACKKLSVAVHGFMDDVKVLQFVPEDARVSVVFSWGNGHFWLLEPEVNRSLSHKPVDSKRAIRLLHALDEMPLKARDEGPWDPLPEFVDLPTGVFGTTDPNRLLELRRAMLERGQCPRLAWNTMDEPRLLKYVKTKAEGRGSFTLRALPPEYEFLARASAQLVREYRGQSLGGWLYSVMRADLRGERGYLTKAERAAVCARVRSYSASRHRRS